MASYRHTHQWRRCLSFLVLIPICISYGGKNKTLHAAPLLQNMDIIFVQQEESTSRAPHGFQNIYVMDKEGTQVTQLTFNTQHKHYEHAALSPDHKYLAVNYYVRDSSGPPRSLLWILDLEGQTEVQLLPHFHSVGDGGIDWDREGFLYFAASETKPQGRDTREVYKIRYDGTTLTQLTHTPHGEADVSVSEDGSLLTYVKAVPTPPFGGRTEIWVMQTDGSAQRRVYTSGQIKTASAHDPEFSPDSSKIIFSQVNPRYKNYPNRPNYNTAHDLYIINIDGTGLQRITPEGAIQIVPDWQDSTLLYTEINEGENYKGLMLINADGSGRRRIGPPGARMGKWCPPRLPPPVLSNEPTESAYQKSAESQTVRTKAKANHDHLQERREKIRQKMQEVRQGINRWHSEGKDPSDVGRMMSEEFAPFIHAGRIDEAERVIDQVLRVLTNDE